MKKLKLNKLKKYFVAFKKIPRWLGTNVFLSFLISLLIALIIGDLMLYKYSFLIENIEPEIGQRIGFKEEAYQRVLEAWEQDQKKFEETNTKNYPNPFD